MFSQERRDIFQTEREICVEDQSVLALLHVSLCFVFELLLECQEKSMCTGQQLMLMQ